jgi:hypothetical protein
MDFKRNATITNKSTGGVPCLVRILGVVLLAALVLAINETSSEASWLIYHKPAFKGKVIDAETKQPIEGVVVVVVYRTWQWWFLEAYPKIVNIRETLTDKQGIFRIPSYTTIIDPVSISRFVDFIIFKPGYGYPTPSGMSADDREIFFSEGFGEMRDMELLTGSVQEGNGPHMRWFKITFGIVELAPVKTWEERRNAIPGDITDYPKSKYPILNDINHEEYQWVEKNQGWKR